eukprot:7912877-Prorocentrum_lima.AAC.1
MPWSGQQTSGAESCFWEEQNATGRGFLLTSLRTCEMAHMQFPHPALFRNCSTTSGANRGCQKWQARG